METPAFEALLEQKVLLLTGLNASADAVNSALKKKDFTAALKNDEQKSEILEKLAAIDRQIGNIKAGGTARTGKTGKTTELIVKVNSLLENLIKTEKENEILATQSAGFFSQARVDLYRKNTG